MMTPPHFATVQEIRADFLGKLEEVREHREAGYWMALCPGHDDRNPSLSIREHDDGVGVKCHAGCTTEEILKPLGMTSEDLQLRAVLRAEDPADVARAKAQEVSDRLSQPKVEPKKENEYYLYTDASGNPLFRVRRGPGKNFSQQRWDAAAGVWRSGLGGTRTTLYRLPELLAVDDSRPVFVCEGEKDADRLAAEGLTATCNPMGAGKWKEEYAQYLKDRRVIVIPDNDAPGEAHAQDILRSLGGSGAILRLPDLPDKGDVSDWLQAGHTARDLLGLMGGINNGSPRSNGHHRRLATFTLKELVEEEFPPVKWIVPDLIPEGTMLLAGKPKMGKSWMALNLVVAVATGTQAFGAFPVEQGDALYLALEDNKRRLKERTLKVLDGKEPNNHLDITIASSRLDQYLLEELETWLDERENPRLIIIDTVARIRGRSAKEKSLYEADYEVGAELTTLAGRYGVAIKLVHHLKKGDADDPMDLISGSTGLTAGVDGAMVLNRTRSSADAVLKAVHRELKDDPELALSWDSELGLWKYIGSAEEYMMGKERREIYDVLARADEPMRPRDVAEALNKPTDQVNRLMQKMLDDGILDRPGEYGKYKISPTAERPPIHPVLSIPSVPPSTSGSTQNTQNTQYTQNTQNTQNRLERERDEEGIWWPDDE